MLNETFRRREELSAFLMVLWRHLLAFNFSAETRLNLQVTAFHVTFKLHLNLHTWQHKFRDFKS